MRYVCLEIGQNGSGVICLLMQPYLIVCSFLKNYSSSAHKPITYFLRYRESTSEKLYIFFFYSYSTYLLILDIQKMAPQLSRYCGSREHSKQCSTNWRELFPLLITKKSLLFKNKTF